MNGVESVDIGCPYCGETIEILIDCSVHKQSYIEDCEVCCRPIDIGVVLDESGSPVVTPAREDDQ
jgi:hypothetical protein